MYAARVPGPPPSPVREAAVVNATRKILKDAGAFFFKTQSGGYGGTPGLPDFVCCYRGVFLGLECKRPSGGVVTPKQKAVGAEIQRAGGMWFVIRSADDAREALRQVDEATR